LVPSNLRPTIASSPIAGQKPGTSGLGKKTKQFMEEHCNNFVQAYFDAVKATCTGTDVSEGSLIIGGDGRYDTSTLTRFKPSSKWELPMKSLVSGLIRMVCLTSMEATRTQTPTSHMPRNLLAGRAVRLMLMAPFLPLELLQIFVTPSDSLAVIAVIAAYGDVDAADAADAIPFFSAQGGLKGVRVAHSMPNSGAVDLVATRRTSTLTCLNGLD
jgi:hypothetical protein